MNRKLQPYQLKIEMPKATGPVTAINKKDEVQAVYYLIAVLFFVHEDEPRDCQLYLDESGTTVSLNGTVVVRGEDKGNRMGKDAKTIPTAIGADNAIVAFIDMPGGATRRDGSGGDWGPFQHSLRQKFVIRDRKSGSEVYSTTNEMKMEVDKNGEKTFFP